MRSRPRRPWRLAITAVVVAFVALACWVGWLAWQVNRDLSAAAEDASRLQVAVSQGDDHATGQAIAELQHHSASAADRTDGTTWSFLTTMPFVGDDADGVRLVSDVLDNLSNDGLDQVATTLQDLGELVPRNGTVSLDRLADLQEPIASGNSAFADADARLADNDSSGYIGRLRVKYRELADQVHTASVALANAHTALTVMPDILGANGPRDYLLVFQNNAEIRATGGLPGAVSVVHTDDGAINLTRQVAANSFGETRQPVLPLTPAEKELYGPQLGTYFLDANFTPDFPRAADLMKARWEQVYPERLDGVLSIDPVALSYVLAATGPVTVGDLTLTSENAVDVLLHEVYIQYNDPQDQDAFFRLVARTVFDTVLTGTGSPDDLIRGLARGASEDRVLVHLFDGHQQEALATTRVAGELPTETSANPQVGAYLNDATGAKMSYYLRYGVQVESDSCSGDHQGLSAIMHLRSVAPSDAASLPTYITGGGRYGTDPGDQLVLVSLYSPVGGTLDDIMVDAHRVRSRPTDVEGRDVITVVVLLEPGSTIDVTWSMETGPDQTGTTQVAVTPSIAEDDSSSVAASSCGA
jgi:hypothetical protein